VSLFSISISVSVIFVVLRKSLLRKLCYGNPAGRKTLAKVTQINAPAKAALDA
jgi:hypothetical protein